MHVRSAIRLQCPKLSRSPTLAIEKSASRLVWLSCFVREPSSFVFSKPNIQVMYSRETLRSYHVSQLRRILKWPKSLSILRKKLNPGRMPMKK